MQTTEVYADIEISSNNDLTLIGIDINRSVEPIAKINDKQVKIEVNPYLSVETANKTMNVLLDSKAITDLKLLEVTSKIVKLQNELIGNDHTKEFLEYQEEIEILNKAENILNKYGLK